LIMHDDLKRPPRVRALFDFFDFADATAVRHACDSKCPVSAFCQFRYRQRLATSGMSD
jgi:hypothetical protein